MCFKALIYLIAFAAALPTQSYGQQLKQSDESDKPLFWSVPGHVGAFGRWKRDNGTVEKNEVSEIQCERGFECTMATATLFQGDLNVGIENFTILRWGKNEIIAEDTAPICVTLKLIINFTDKSVIALHSPKASARGFSGCELATRVRTSTLVGKWAH